MWPDPDQNYLVITDHCFFLVVGPVRFRSAPGVKKIFQLLIGSDFVTFRKVTKEKNFLLKIVLFEAGNFSDKFFTFFGWNLTWNQSRPSNFGSIKIV